MLLGVVAISAFIAERVWLSAEPMRPDGDPDELQAQAVGIFAGQVVRKLAYCEVGVIFSVIVGFAGLVRRLADAASAASPAWS